MINKTEKAIKARKKQWQRIEQEFRSRIVLDEVARGEIEMMKRAWAEEEAEIGEESWWLDEEGFGERKIELVGVYGRLWRGNDAEKNEERQAEESARLVSEVLYWHLLRDFTEAEKFECVERIRHSVVNEEVLE